MQRFIVLHTNDIHGNIDGLARIATLVQQVRDESDIPVLYFDAGDIEDHGARLSAFTKGVAMYRVLGASGCDLETVGNGGILRYGPSVVADYAKVACYPLLLANLCWPDGKLLTGVRSTAMLNVGGIKLGIIGITSEIGGVYSDSWGLNALPVVPLVRSCANQLRQEGADVVFLLSHMGLNVDRELASELQQDISLIIGAHTHEALPEGERVGNMLIVQAGMSAQYMGRLDLVWDGKRLEVDRASLMAVTEDIYPAVRVVKEVEAAEADLASFLDEIIGELVEPLDYASDRECGTANLMADMLRERMEADVAVVTSGAAFAGPLPAGRLRRKDLWDVCSNPGNPGVVVMTGAQLTDLIQRGLDREKAKRHPRPLRGLTQGLMHISGACVRCGQLFVGAQLVEPGREYRVAGSDWEFDSNPVDGWYLNPEWGLKPDYDTSVTLPEALEEYLEKYSSVAVEMGRLG